MRAAKSVCVTVRGALTEESLKRKQTLKKAPVCVSDWIHPGYRKKSVSGPECWRSLGNHTILFVSQKNQVTHLLVTCYWTALTPSGASKNIPENVLTVFCEKMFAILTL